MTITGFASTGALGLFGEPGRDVISLIHSLDLALSDDVEFSDRFILSDPFIAENRQIKRAIFAIKEEFSNAATSARTMLQAMTGETGTHVEIGDVRMHADEGVLVQSAIFIVTGPCIGHLDRVKSRHAVVKRRPDHLLEQVVVGVVILIVGCRVFQWRATGDCRRPLRDECRHRRCR